MCIPCQQTKVFPLQASGLLHLLLPSKEPWEQVTADFIIELPESQGYDAVLVAANHHTKCAHFIPSVLAVSTEGTAWLFWDHVWKHHGWAQKIITDQETQFTAKFTCTLNQLLRMEMALSTPRQMDKLSESTRNSSSTFVCTLIICKWTGWTGCPLQSSLTTTMSTWQPASHPSSSSMVTIHSSPWLLRNPRSTTPWLMSLQIPSVEHDSMRMMLSTMLPPQ
jgi:hypothetical protein